MGRKLLTTGSRKPSPSLPARKLLPDASVSYDGGVFVAPMVVPLFTSTIIPRQGEWR